MRPQLLLITLAGCGDRAFAVNSGQPIGLGLTAEVTFATNECEDGTTCPTVFPVGARATNNAISIVGIDDVNVMVHGERVGTGTGTVATDGFGSLDFDVEIVPLVQHRMQLAQALYDPFFAVPNAHMMGTAVGYAQINVYGNEAQPRGFSELAVDPGTTEAVLRPHAHGIVWWLETGAREGWATIVTELGFEHAVEIVAPERMTALALYSGFDLARVDTLPLGMELSDSAEVSIVPSLADGRVVIGCPTARPIVTTSNGNVRAFLHVIPADLPLCKVGFDRMAPGNTIVTVTWGAVSASVVVTDAT